MRIMIAGTGSGCGKTTVSLAVMRSLMRAGHTVQAFKSGPDYIDPGYHARATGRPSYNLDMFMLSEASIRQIIAMGMEGADTGIIEGAMGYYDGLGAEGACSAHALAVATQTPVVLVIDASGSASSAAAVALGFQTFREKSGIKGYFLNNVSSARHYALVKQAIEARTGLPCVGWLPKNACAPWKSRHLGLIQAAEQQDLEKALEALAEAVVLEEPFFEILSGTKPVVAGPLRVASFAGRQRMGIARDNAFAFYYAADFAMLEGMGFSLEYFSPLRDEAVPSGVDALWLGGGYPELYAER
ncbi:MAG: cobyrinate a,c-diamide synthase, partial [Clostridiales bacterium]|nr:cobyrinate a,c-diamide synthase [Clostridiales bacterium]